MWPLNIYTLGDICNGQTSQEGFLRSASDVKPAHLLIIEFFSFKYYVLISVIRLINQELKLLMLRLF